MHEFQRWKIQGRVLVREAVNYVIRLLAALIVVVSRLRLVNKNRLLAFLEKQKVVLKRMQLRLWG